MMKTTYQYIITIAIFLFVNMITFSQVTLEKEVKITDLGLHFNGVKVARDAVNNGDDAPYNFFFGRSISAHGDCVKTFGKYVFMTWYRGGKEDRHVMLSRYNTETGSIATIEFPHRHTGYLNQYWIGESHNTIAVAISPLDGTIHLLYDMHAYSRTRPTDGSLSSDYFRYSYSSKNTALLADEDFTLNKFVKNTNGGYKHLSLNGGEDYNNFNGLTYPQFFLNDGGDLFMYMREGGNNNGAYKFSKYDANTSQWSSFKQFNVLNAKNNSGITYNWGLYGNMKYVNGKVRVGFQRRSSNNSDKYQYQNGVYYAYSDDQNGLSDWKNHKGEAFTLPLLDADKVKVMEPGDYVQTTQEDQVRIVGGFDWTVTENGDVHIISEVKDNQFNITKYLHTYKPAGAEDFITSEDFSGASAIYTSGNNVYVIGLDGARVFVEKAEGGTNNFTRVYEARTGKTFDHGRVYISNGKVYYYLMENKTGSAQPLYLQIIDLGINQEPFRVSLTNPLNQKTYYVGEEIQLTANAINDNGVISKVQFKVDEAVFGEVTSNPYTLNWIPTTSGTHTVQAVAYNNQNETVVSPIITINVEIKDYTDLTGDTYRIRNVATGKYLDSENSDVIASDSGEGIDKQWEIVKAGDFYNIESKTSRGVLRAAGSPTGEIINTAFPAPNNDSDKQWEVIYNNTDKTYRFKARNGTRYLTHQTNNLIEWSSSENNTSKWFVESTTTALSLDDIKKDITSLKVYPNPTKNNFTISFNGFTNVSIRIYDILGKKVYQNTTSKQNILINNNSKFKSGIYLVKVIGDDQKVLNTKLIIE